ncbi:MAG TPA: CoA transferase [Acidimicrobiales bacterium]|nr:CoA transferase [Acidimicrobiales bacterium]
MATDDDRRALAEWAASGAMAITGRADGPPLGPPDRLVPGLRHLGDVVAARSAWLGREVRLDPVAVLGERAAVGGLRRLGRTSCGGTTRLVRAADGWLAVALPRPEDRELLPAWLGIDVSDDPWATVAAEVARQPAREAAERAWLLGLPVSDLADEPIAPPPAAPPLAPLPVRATPIPGPIPDPRPLAQMTAIDLTSLWAGPLCGHLLGIAGARVVKVESTARPDGSRHGPTDFFDLVNGGKKGVALDLAGDQGWDVLRRLLARADVVIEGSRPRVLEQHGIVAADLVAAGGPRVWVSITGHGRTEPGRDRVAFGDDAAVAGGLVVADETGPCFCADAVADPVAGLAAAAACLDALAVAGRWLLDVPMAGVAASLAGPTLVPEAGTGPNDALDVAPPRGRPVTSPGPLLGEHTGEVLNGLGVMT